MGKKTKNSFPYTGVRVVLASVERMHDDFVGSDHWFSVDEESGALYIYDDPSLDGGEGFVAAYTPKSWESVRLVS